LRRRARVPLVTRTGHPQPCAAVVDGAALKVAEHRKLATYEPQKLVVFGSEVGGHWDDGAHFREGLGTAEKAHRALHALRATALAGGDFMVEQGVQQ